MEKLISNSTNIGDVVLDPFLGVGTTAIACVNIDRKYIGVELDEGYFNTALQEVADCKNKKQE